MKLGEWILLTQWGAGMTCIRFTTDDETAARRALSFAEEQTKRHREEKKRGAIPRSYLYKFVDGGRS